MRPWAIVERTKVSDSSPRKVEIADVGATGREELRILATENSVAQDAHGGRPYPARVTACRPGQPSERLRGTAFQNSSRSAATSTRNPPALSGLAGVPDTMASVGTMIPTRDGRPVRGDRRLRCRPGRRQDDDGALACADEAVSLAWAICWIGGTLLQLVRLRGQLPVLARSSAAVRRVGNGRAGVDEIADGNSVARR